MLLQEALDRLAAAIQDLVNQPAKGLLVAGAFLLFLWWLTRRR
jgi:hypothetical protein